MTRDKWIELDRARRILNPTPLCRYKKRPFIVLGRILCDPGIDGTASASRVKMRLAWRNNCAQIGEQQCVDQARPEGQKEIT